MAYSFRHLTFAVALSALGSSLPGQEPSGAEVDLHFTVFSQSVLEEVAYTPAKDADRKTLLFYSAHRSPVYDYQGPRLLKFYQGSQSNVPVAEYEVGPDLQRALLLFVPAPANAAPGTLPFQIVGVDDSFEHIPVHSFVVLNLSGRPFQAEYGRQAFAVPVGLSESVPSTSQKYLKLIADVEGKSTAVGGVQFGLTTGQRAIVVVYPPAKKTGLQPLIRTLYEESEGPAAPKKHKK